MSERNLIKLDRVELKEALNGKIQDITLCNKDFTIIDYDYNRQFFDSTPLYLPNKVLIKRHKITR